MIYLESTDKSIEVLLTGAVTTNELDWTMSVIDITAVVIKTEDAWSDDGVTSGATPVTVVPAPDGVIRQIKYISIYNKDTANATVIVRLNNNGTYRILQKQELEPGETLLFVG